MTTLLPGDRVPLMLTSDAGTTSPRQGEIVTAGETWIRVRVGWADYTLTPAQLAEHSLRAAQYGRAT